MVVIDLLNVYTRVYKLCRVSKTSPSGLVSIDLSMAVNQIWLNRILGMVSGPETTF